MLTEDTGLLGQRQKSSLLTATAIIRELAFFGTGSLSPISPEGHKEEQVMPVYTQGNIADGSLSSENPELLC